MYKIHGIFVLGNEPAGLGAVLQSFPSDGRRTLALPGGIELVHMQHINN